MFRADELDVFIRQPALRFCVSGKICLVYAPAAARATYPSPEAVAEVLPPATEALKAVNAAIAAGAEDTDPKTGARRRMGVRNH